jgi:(E)-4-hydroxy-3-methylbut-2-enyl-diphosphate synthase
MTNTLTDDVSATVKQIQSLQNAGADMVRISIPTMEAASAFKEIKSQVNIPLITDIHFDYKIALKVAEYGADCLRINPGNIGSEDRVREVVASAKDKNIPIRIGVNAGSLEKELLRKYKEPTAKAMVESAFRHIDILDKLGFDNFKISLKASSVAMTYDAYVDLASQIDNPLHLGITEAGSFRSGSVKSAVGLGLLLTRGIGDTIRVSLASNPVDEIKVGFDILKSLDLRHKGVNLIACPSCSRQNFDVIKVVSELENRLDDIIEPIDVAIIGCVVNGPGEAKEVAVGLTGGQPNLLYINGEKSHKLSNDELIDEIEFQVRSQIK